MIFQIMEAIVYHDLFVRNCTTVLVLCTSRTDKPSHLPSPTALTHRNPMQSGVWGPATLLQYSIPY